MPPTVSLPERVDSFFRREAPLATGEGLLVAFSGGPDSTALLVTLAERLPGRGVRLSAAHLDHGLDEGAGERARAAAALADRLAVPFVAARREVRSAKRRGEGIEAAARRVRYDFLEEERRRLGARYLATAHHREDQA